MCIVISFRLYNDQYVVDGDDVLLIMMIDLGWADAKSYLRGLDQQKRAVLRRWCWLALKLRPRGKQYTVDYDAEERRTRYPTLGRVENWPGFIRRCVEKNDGPVLHAIDQAEYEEAIGMAEVDSGAD